MDSLDLLSRPDEEAITIELDGCQVVISSPGRVLFSERGETKLDLIEFYRAVRDPLVAAWAGDPCCRSASRRCRGELLLPEARRTDELRIDLDPTCWRHVPHGE